MSTMPTVRRLDLTHQRHGQRIYRAVTLTPAADGGASLALHVGQASMTVALSAADLWQLLGMVTDVQMSEHSTAGEPS